MLDVDALAAEIRRVDGSNSLGAGALAEALMPFIKLQVRYEFLKEKYSSISDRELEITYINIKRELESRKAKKDPANNKRSLK